MDSTSASGLVLLVFAACIFIYGAALRCGLVRLRDQNNRLGARLDALLKQRYEKILELLALLPSDLSPERKLLAEANDAVASATTIRQKAEADLQLTEGLQILFESEDKNRRLASSETYLTLRNHLAALQTQIADHREVFNGDIRSYNTRIGQFPDTFVASIMGMRRRQRFEASQRK
ncbi:MAG TPA: LemA family protein [Candidatus Sulfotelmatobacter sp.]|nr:LemA family protein [Candidatus Sulfotelmatobacter sp.]